MKYYNGWSLSEFYNLPVGLRNWFVKKLSDQIEKENKQMEEAKSSSSTGNGSYTTSNPPMPSKR